MRRQAQGLSISNLTYTGIMYKRTTHALQSTKAEIGDVNTGDCKRERGTSKSKARGKKLLKIDSACDLLAHNRRIEVRTPTERPMTLVHFFQSVAPC
jgi:hypothetical protein